MAVVGAGVFGGWAALHLQRLGARVTLVEAWEPGHARASSGGLSRVLRHGYADAEYVAMARDARRQWLEAQRLWGLRLFTECGVLWLLGGGHGEDDQAARNLAAAGIPHRVESAAETARRYPALSPAGLTGALLEPEAGVLAARTACRAVQKAVTAAGGRWVQARVEAAPLAAGELLPLRLQGGGRLAADAAVFATGSWTGHLLPAVGQRLRPALQSVLFLAAPDPGHCLPALPVWAERGERFWYGIPAGALHGFKVADDTPGPEFDPDRPPAGPGPEEVARCRAYLARRFPALASAPLLGTRTCPYELTADRHLILDRLEADPRVVVASGGSGHGFKLAPVVGEWAARAALGRGDPPERFALARRPLHPKSPD